MTKVTILGQSHEDVKPKKKIELIGVTNGDGHVRYAGDNSWDNIVLVRKNYEDGLDLMLCFDDTFKDGNPFKYRALMVGHFNDGEV